MRSPRAERGSCSAWRSSSRSRRCAARRRVERTVQLKHRRRRLRRLGQDRALDPPDDGDLGPSDPSPPAARLRGRGPDRRGQRAAGDRAGARPAPGGSCTSRAGTSSRASSWCAAGRTSSSARCWRSWPNGSTCACWSGRAPRCPPSTQPGRGAAEGGGAVTRDTRIRCEMDPREHPVHCHHEKTIVVDGELAFVGGIDLTDDSPATASTRRGIRRAGGSAGMTWPHGCGARAWPTWPPTSPCAGTR